MKFKVWDKKRKEFTSGGFVIDEEGELLVVSGKTIHGPDSRFIPVYSTAQTDKNGVELFHKDIVKDQVGGILIAEWDKALSMLFWRVVANGVRVDFSPQHKIEIIGNNFENPELLESNEK